MLSFINKMFSFEYIVKLFSQKYLFPGMFLLNNKFVLRFNILLYFFFPAILILFVTLDSYLTIDYILFFYTDEADFDDFIAFIYMFFFFFIILADYDVDNDNNEEVINLAESALVKSNTNDLTTSYVYYTKDSSSGNKNYNDDFVLFSESWDVVNSFVLLNLSKISVKTNIIAKMPIKNYILDDNFSLEMSTENAFNSFAGVTVDDASFEDSNDIYVYSLYFMLFDLELSRLALFV